MCCSWKISWVCWTNIPSRNWNHKAFWTNPVKGFLGGPGRKKNNLLGLGGGFVLWWNKLEKSGFSRTHIVIANWNWLALLNSHLSDDKLFWFLHAYKICSRPYSLEGWLKIYFLSFKVDFRFTFCGKKVIFMFFL